MFRGLGYAPSSLACGGGRDWGHCQYRTMYYFLPTNCSSGRSSRDGAGRDQQRRGRRTGGEGGKREEGRPVHNRFMCPAAGQSKNAGPLVFVGSPLGKLSPPNARGIVEDAAGLRRGAERLLRFEPREAGFRLSELVGELCW